jgi:ABC-type uncharacterized transport system permease subunit
LAFALFGSQDGVMRFGFAPALSVTVWLMLTFYVLEQHWFPRLQTRWTLMALGASVVLIAAVFPGAPMHTNASPLLPLHWVAWVRFGFRAKQVLPLLLYWHFMHS